MKSFDADLHEYRIDGVKVPGVSDILESTGYINKRFFKAGSADFGSKVHKACSLLDYDLLTIDDIEDSIKGYAEGWLKFKQESGITFEEIEKFHISDKYRFGGTPDRVGVMRGRKCIADIKSGAALSWHKLQLNAYRILVDASIDLLIGVYLKPGNYSLTPYTVSDEFLSVLGKYYKNQKQIQEVEL